MTDLRYTLHEVKGGWLYGDWHIAPADWIRPHPSVDWDWWHDDFDGAPDANDYRCGSAASRDACIEAIHAWEDEQ